MTTYNSDLFSDGRKFQWRAFGSEFQIYSVGLDHWAVCQSATVAEFITEALNEKFFREKRLQNENPLI